jgi:hypothetical protein
MKIIIMNALTATAFKEICLNIFFMHRNILTRMKPQLDVLHTTE